MAAMQPKRTRWDMVPTRPPQKRFLTVTNAAPLPITGAQLDTNMSTYMNAMGQGTGDNQRVGRRVRFTRFRMRIYATVATAAGSQTDGARFVLVLDHQSNGATSCPSSAAAGGTGPLTSAVGGGIFDVKKSERYTLLMDETKYLGSSPTTVAPVWPAVGPQNCVFEWDIPLDFVTVYKSNGTTGADIMTNTLWLLFLGDASGNANFGTGSCIMDYEDC